MLYNYLKNATAAPIFTILTILKEQLAGKALSLL